MKRRERAKSLPVSALLHPGNDDGVVAVMVAVLIVALLGFAAMAVDAGAYYAERRQMQTAADAAALAGVQDLPDSPTAATASADNYAAINSPEADDRGFTIGSTFAPNDTITAELTDPDMGLFFARFLGLETARVQARAVAVVGSPRTYGSGLMPFGIMANGTTQSPYGYTPGGVIPLVVDNGAQSQGNWHYVDLVPWTDGANQTKTVILNGGTTDPLSIGDIINTQTGEPNNPNYKALVDYFHTSCSPHELSALVYNDEEGVYEPIHAADGTPCTRLITCPVITVVNGGDPYDWDVVTGNEAVRIEGFLNMFISNDPKFKDGTLLAEFVQVVPTDTLDPGGLIDYGGIVRWLEE